MMITRFNAECKERPNGKGKFTGKERLGIGAASMVGIPYRIAEEAFDISRTHYHNLGKKADCVLENLCATEDAFALLYRQRAWDYRSEEYHFMEKKLYHIFGERLPEARETRKELIRHTCRASSPDENVNGRLRVFMNARRGIPAWQFPLSFAKAVRLSRIFSVLTNSA